ncbi:MAG TPA: flagellar hook-length control protein FliK [Dyella sp.]|uniref:flagellar hook-length control protein FliK n=1 Tax=Dyella sp. TaxID=1869338 RepID=UPI002F92B55C
MTASAPLPVVATPPPIPMAAPSPQPADGDDRFDSQLDAARRQQQQAASNDDAPSAQDSEASTAKTATTDDAKKPTHAHDDKDDNNDAGDTSLASSMLQLLGQSVPPAQGTQAPAPTPDVSTAAPAGLSALALSMSQALPATDAQAVKDPGATASQAKLAGIPANLLPINPKLAGLGKAGAADDKAVDKTGDDAWHHLQTKGGGDGKTATAATTTVKPTNVSEAATAELPAATVHKNTDITAMLGLSDAVQSGAPTAQPHMLQMQSPVDSSGFAQELGQQVAWLGGQEIKQAQIRLNPEELGQLEVKVSVEHNRVDVIFAAQHPAAVTAVQQTLGQLDTMLAGQGLSLGQAQVGQQQAQGFGGSSSGKGGHARGGDAAGNDVEVSPVVQRLAVGLLDTFA